jgi:arylsulfatase A-like enzyme
MLATLALLFQTQLPSVPPTHAVPRARPNVLLILVDDLGVDHVEWHPVGQAAGNWAPTPVLSALADEALVFTRAYGTPICSPSRATLLTGRYPFRHGIGANIEAGQAVLPLSEVTLAELLTPAGYRTGAFGKWHVALDRDDPNLQGFQHFDGSIFNIGGGGNGGYYDWVRIVNGASTIESGYATTVVTDSAMAWISSVDGARAPWFAYVAYHAPHVPYEAPPPSLNPLTNAQANDPDETIYHGMVEALDAEIGRLLSVVDTRDTLVIFTGDNGPAQGIAQLPIPPGKAKPTPYEGGVLVPAMVFGATVGRAGEDSGLVHLVDFFRTILDVAEAPGPGVPTDSVSLLDPVRPRALRWVPLRERIFAGRFKPNAAPPFGPFTVERRALRGIQFKLVRTESGDQLYDLVADPWESTDLIPLGLTPTQQTAYDGLVAELVALLGS